MESERENGERERKRGEDSLSRLQSFDLEFKKTL